MQRSTTLSIRFAQISVLAILMSNCGREDAQPTQTSQLAGQTCNYTAYFSCLDELTWLDPETPGYLAKKIKCDAIWSRCN